MADPFLSEIRLFAFNFPPKAWALCNGQLLPINQNQALFSLLGTTYGGNGTVNFALPNLQGRVPIGSGPGYALGQRGGDANHGLTINEMPAHTHSLRANSGTGTQASPVGNVWATDSNGFEVYRSDGNQSMRFSAIATAGLNQLHPNEMPSLVVNACIALQGIFPSTA